MNVYKGLFSPQMFDLDTTCELRRETKHANNDVILPDVCLKLLFTDSKYDLRQHCQNIPRQGAVEPHKPWPAGQPNQIIPEEDPKHEDLEYWLSLSG